MNLSFSHARFLDVFAAYNDALLVAALIPLVSASVRWASEVVLRGVAPFAIMLFEYLNAMPLSVLADGPQEKSLLREAARPFLSRSVRHRAKRPFWAPPSVSREGTRLHELTQDTLRSGRVASIPFLAEAGVTRLLDGAARLGPMERRVLDPLLTMMVSICSLDEAMHRPPRPAPSGAGGRDGRHALG